MFCNECGAPNPDAAKFCNSCGRSLTNSAPPPPRIDPDVVKRQFPIDTEVSTGASGRNLSNSAGNASPIEWEAESSSGLGKYIGIFLAAIFVIAVVVFVTRKSLDSNTITSTQVEPPHANVIIHPYDLVKDPFKYKNTLVILDIIPRPMLSNGSIMGYLPAPVDRNSDTSPEDEVTLVQAGLLGLRFSRMTSADTALYDVMAANTDFPGHDTDVLGQIAVIVPTGQHELALVRAWVVEPLGTLEGTNALGARLRVPLVKFWRYASVSRGG
jgi:hypothetical protein